MGARLALILINVHRDTILDNLKDTRPPHDLPSLYIDYQSTLPTSPTRRQSDH